MVNFRQDVINAVKAMGITSAELGFKPITVSEVDRDFLNGVKRYIQQVEEVQAARECIPEKYWEDLGIADKKYKLVEVELTKVITKRVKVAVPESYDVDYIEPDDDVLGDVESLSYDNYDIDDEEDWEVQRCDVTEDNLTADEINHKYNQEIWNYDDFEDLEV